MDIFHVGIIGLSPDTTNIRKLFVAISLALIVIFNAISVMGKETPPSFDKFIVQDGIATDTKTGLTWLRFEHGQTWQNNTVVGETKLVAWEPAFEVAKQFNQCGGYAGFTDWRLPTNDELITLLEKHKNQDGNYINAEFFPKSSSAWSSWVRRTKRVKNHFSVKS